jgi:hypothetical protein
MMRFAGSCSTSGYVGEVERQLPLTFSATGFEPRVVSVSFSATQGRLPLAYSWEALRGRSAPRRWLAIVVLVVQGRPSLKSRSPGCFVPYRTESDLYRG